jgi:MFS transporter, ACS family, tartrate transporter
MSTTEPILPAIMTIGAHPPDEAIGRSAMRKASLHLIPLIAIGYGISYVDRVNISFAALQMNRDLHFSASIYGFGAGLFFLSYAACEVPSNLMLVRFGARRWIARIMLTWGILAMGMMFVKTPLQFYAMRFLLGMAEAGFFPGVVFYLMQWFPAEMRARTVSRFYLAIPLSTAVMGAVAGALLNLQGRLGLAGWQWLFLAEGLPAVLLSVVFLIYLPDNPVEAKWLTDEERGWIFNQLQADDAAGTAVHCDSVSRALLDPRVWLLGFFLVCTLGCAYAYNFSAPAIIQKLTGFSTTNVGFVVALTGLLSALVMVLNASHSDRANERFLHIAIPCLLMAAGYIVGGASTTPLVAIPALTISFVSALAIYGSFWAIPSGFLKGKSAAAGIAAINSLGIVGGFLGPVWMGWARDLTGNYQRGIMTLAIPSLMAAGVILFMRRRANERAVEVREDNSPLLQNHTPRAF